MTFVTEAPSIVAPAASFPSNGCRHAPLIPLPNQRSRASAIQLTHPFSSLADALRERRWNGEPDQRPRRNQTAEPEYAKRLLSADLSVCDKKMFMM
jgi:hypothetical protein